MKKEVCENCRPLFEKLLKRIELQDKRILELEKRLAFYENPHTPPSQRRGRYPKPKRTGGKIGAPLGHIGTTRPTPKPNRFKKLALKRCPDCDKHLGRPRIVRKQIIEDIPDPQPLKITQFTIPYYFCNHCQQDITPTDPELPFEGRFGPNLQAEVALMRFEDRLPDRKITDTLNRRYGLMLTPATVLDITRRVADQIEPVYEKIKQEVRDAAVVNADETGHKIKGVKHWVWTFVATVAILFMIRPSRGQGPIKEALGEKFMGLLGCDGWTSYPKCVERIQRCWAHLLREAKVLAEKGKEQAKLLYGGLNKIFKRIKKITTKTIQTVRTRTYNWCLKELDLWIKTCKHHTELKKFANKIENGKEHWLTCVLHPEIEPTNNKAERALREIVVQRKISSLWNKKGARIKEITMSVLATWRLRGLNTFSMVRVNLSS